jgi:hypothetical protein
MNRLEWTCEPIVRRARSFPNFSTSMASSGCPLSNDLWVISRVFHYTWPSVVNSLHNWTCSARAVPYDITGLYCLCPTLLHSVWEQCQKLHGLSWHGSLLKFSQQFTGCFGFSITGTGPTLFKTSQLTPSPCCDIPVYGVTSRCVKDTPDWCTVRDTQHSPFRGPPEERFRLKFVGIDIQLLGELRIEGVKPTRIYKTTAVLPVFREQSDYSIVDTLSRTRCSLTWWWLDSKVFVNLPRTDYITWDFFGGGEKLNPELLWKFK